MDGHQASIASRAASDVSSFVELANKRGTDVAIQQGRTRFYAHYQECQEALRQNIDRRAQNRATRSVLKTHVRKVRDAVTAGKADEADAALRVAAKKLDQAAAHGVIHANAAARLKSRLSAAIKAAKGKKK